jgi:hypothetical protein
MERSEETYIEIPSDEEMEEACSSKENERPDVSAV